MKLLLSALIALSGLSAAHATSIQDCGFAASDVALKVFEVNNAYYTGFRPAVVPGPTGTNFKVVQTGKTQKGIFNVYEVYVGNNRSRALYDVLVSIDETGCRVSKLSIK